jgi:hypothetical protein
MLAMDLIKKSNESLGENSKTSAKSLARDVANGGTSERSAGRGTNGSKPGTSGFNTAREKKLSGPRG